MTGICCFRSQHSRTNSPDWGTGWTNNKANWIGCDYSGRKPTSHVPTTPRWVSRLISRFLSLVTCSPLDNSRTPLNIAPLIAHTEDPIPFDTNERRWSFSWTNEHPLSITIRESHRGISLSLREAKSIPANSFSDDKLGRFESVLSRWAENSDVSLLEKLPKSNSFVAEGTLQPFS